MKTEKNSYDYRINSELTNISPFIGEYEPVKYAKYISIDIYVDGTDRLEIFHTDDPSGATLTTETFSNISNFKKIYTTLKSRFVRIIITTTETVNIKRFYDVYLIDDDKSQNIILNNIYDLFNTRGSKKLWGNLSDTGETVYNNDTSDIVDLSDKPIKNLNFYGSAIKRDELTDYNLSLVVQFSTNGTTFYNTQYVYTFNGDIDFGFSIYASPKYARIKAIIT